MSFKKSEVVFDSEATPNFPMEPGRWYMVWMGGDLVNVPGIFHSFQVPFEFDKEGVDIDELVEKAGKQAAKLHPGSTSTKVVVSVGQGRWQGKVGLHVEGS